MSTSVEDESDPPRSPSPSLTPETVFDDAMLRHLVNLRSYVSSTQRAVRGCIVALAVRPPSQAVLAWGYVRSLLHEYKPARTPKNWQPPTDLHAEADLVASAAHDGTALRGCTVYVSSMCCVTCLRLLVAAGVRRVVHPPAPFPAFYAKDAQHFEALTSRFNVAVHRTAVLPPHPGGPPPSLEDLGLQPKSRRGARDGDDTDWCRAVDELPVALSQSPQATEARPPASAKQ